MKKLIAIILAAVLMLSFAACAANNPDDQTTGTDIEQPGATENTGAPAEDKYAKYQKAYEKYDPNTVVMTVNGTDVVWSDYYSWIFNIVNQIETYYGATDWTQEIEPGYTFNDWVMEYARSSASQYIAIEQGAKAAGVTLTDADRAELDALYESDVEQYGGGDRDAFLKMLGEMFISEDYYLYMGEVSYYYDNFFTHVYGEQGSLLTDAEAMSFAEGQGYLRAKHILYKTLSDDGSSLGEEVVAEKKAAAEAALAALRAAPDQDAMLALFEDYIKNEGEDPGSLAYPNGYYFVDGEMVPEFENGTKALGMYEVSDIVESPYGYHIILRLPIAPDDIVDVNYGVSLRYTAASYFYGNMISGLTESAEVVYKDNFEALNINDLFA